MDSTSDAKRAARQARLAAAEAELGQVRDAIQTMHAEMRPLIRERELLIAEVSAIRNELDGHHD